MMDNICLFTGGFDPVHSGHIAAIEHARTLGRVVIGVNSDEWLIRKKGQAFMPLTERMTILSQFKNVLQAIEFDDFDDTACDAIQKAKEMFPKSIIVFANGGDRTNTNTPEIDRFKDDPRVTFEFSVGGNYKRNSSSWILSQWKHPTEDRAWGKFVTYYDSQQAKVKRLIIDPTKSISMQYHNRRSEFWFVDSGVGNLYTMTDNGEVCVKTLQKHDSYHIEVGQWHRVENSGDQPLCVIEIQYGDICVEEDIVRL